MGKRIWTPAQRAAIDYSGRNLLLSAAAGSGKTATLTERITQLVCSPDSPAEISRILCVTFTRAAAAELRQRIGAALREALAADPTNARLSRQLCDLGRAEITTIHAFCYRLLRSCTAELGLPPSVAVAQESDMNALKRQVMGDVLTDCFAEGSAEFLAMADALGGSRREDALDDVLLTLAGEMAARGVDADGLGRLAGEMAREADPLRAPYGRSMKTYVQLFARHYEKYFAFAAEYLGEDGAYKGYLPAALECLALCRRLEDAADAGYDAVRQALSAFAPPSRLGSVKAEHQTEQTVFFRGAYKEFKEEVSALLTTAFAPDAGACAEAGARTAEISRTAARVLDRFFTEFERRKRDRGVLDFGDLEEMSLRLLTDESGAPTDAARRIGAAYDYIFIDEYQDTNRTQDAIFTALAAGGGRRFMVGDIKQSIYRFRGAEPQVFSSYRRAWPAAEERPRDDRPGESIFMQENFRCDETVVKFVNLVSRHLFPWSAIPFTEEDALRYAKVQSEDYRPAPVEICLIGAPAEEDDAAAADAASPEGDDTPATEKKKFRSLVQEAEYVADRIARMLGVYRREDGVPVTPGDVAILLRSPGTDGTAFEEALSRRGIPVQNRTAATLYEEPEVLLMLSVLRAMDNPGRDIDLAGAMKSPVFGFSLDDLIRIRRAAPEGSLWDAVREAGGLFDGPAEADAGTAGDEPASADEIPPELADRCGAFCRRLSELRADSREMGADRILLRLYEEADVIRLSQGDPERGPATVLENLRALYDQARLFESRGGGGLYLFLRWVQAAAEESAGAAPPAENAVRILSIHQSKGLEFPVCFLSRAGKAQSTRGTTASLLFDAGCGAVMRLPDAEGFVRCDTPQRRCVARAIHAAETEEEMRILYVALSRARERLIITHADRNPEADLEISRLSAPFLSPYTALSGGTYLSWMLDALAAARMRGEDLSFVTVSVSRVDAGAGAAVPVPDFRGEAVWHTDAPEASAMEEWRQLFEERFAFRYPLEHLRSVPAKMTVSRLHPSVLDGEEEEDAAPRTAMDRTPAPATVGERNRPPRFLSGKTEFEASFAGTATHVFMQFCDFGELERTGAAAELARLRRLGFLSDAMAEAVRLEEIEGFRRSALFARLRRAVSVRREFRFNAALAAGDFTADPALAEKLRETGTDVIVQGVVDCLMEEADGRIVLIDYKTDRLSRAEMENPALAAEKLLSRHGDQLHYYRQVCQRMLGRPVDECLIYSLPLGDCVDVGE